MRKKTVVAGIIVVLLVLVSILIFLPRENTEKPDLQSPAEVTTEASTETKAEEVESTEEPETEAPTEPETEVPTEPAVVLHSGIREDGTFGEGALLIGDSLTYGLVSVYLTNSGYLGDAMYMAFPGAPVTVYSGGPCLTSSEPYYCLYSPQFKNLLMCEGVELVGSQATAIYVMMGTNYSANASVDTYIAMVNHMLENCPEATVYLLLVPYSNASYIKYEEANANISEAYAHFQQEGNPRVKLVDTQTAIGQNLLGDGIHLTEIGQQLWYEALVAFARENGIAE